MELHELHVLQFRAGIVGKRVAVARVLPAVARDLVSSPDAARREHHRLRAKRHESPALALVAEGADDAATVLEQSNDRALHVHVDPLVDPMILERPDHLETRAIAHVREPRIAMAAEIPLEDAPVLRPIEHRAPGLELANPVGRLFRVQLRHAPVVDVLPAPHGVGEVDLPVVAVVDVGHRRRNAAFGHHSVRLT